MIPFLHTLRPVANLANKLETLARGKLWLQAIIGLFLGVIVGLLLGPDFSLVSPEVGGTITNWLALPGEVFLRLIKMVLIPLVVASIIRGIGASSIPQLRAVGIRLIAYVLLSTAAAASIGIALARTIRPGTYVWQATGSESADVAATATRISQPLPQLIANIVPDNPLQAALHGEMLGVVIFAVFIGIVFATKEQNKIGHLLQLFDGILDVCMTVVQWAMWLVPLAVFGLTARLAAQAGIETLVGMGVYVATVIAGLLILLLLYYALVLFAGMNPLFFARKIAKTQLLAFSTSMSAAVMPLSIRTAQEDLGIDSAISEVVIPLGTTVNMAGTALYQSVAILFLAQIAGIELTITQTGMLVLTLIASSIGTPSTPGVGVIILGTIAGSFGIPTTGLVLLIGVDRILDMCRTVLNVTGDLTACVLLDRPHKKLNILHTMQNAAVGTLAGAQSS